MAQETLKITITADNKQAVQNIQETVTATTQLGAAFKRVTPITNQVNQSLVNVSRVAQDAPYGFIGIANNLNPLLESFQSLKQTTGSASSALKEMAKGLMGPAGIGLALGVVSSLIVAFGPKIAKFINGTDAASEAQDKFKESLDKARASASESGIKLLAYIRVAEDATNTDARRKEALDAVRSELGKVNASYTATIKTTDDARKAVTLYTDALVAQAITSRYIDEIADKNIKLSDATKLAKKAGEDYAASVERSKNMVNGYVDASVTMASVTNRDKNAFDAANKSVTDLTNGIADLNKEVFTTIDNALKSNNAYYVMDKGAKDLDKTIVEVTKNYKAFTKLTAEQVGTFIPQQRNALPSTPLAPQSPLTKGPSQAILEAEAIANAATEQAKFNYLLNEAEVTSRFIAQGLGNVFQALQSGDNIGESLVNAFRDMAIELAKMVIQALIFKAIMNALGMGAAAGTTSDLTGGLLGGLGKLLGFTPMAEGGIVSKPTFAVVGEGGESEAVMPLSKLDTMLSNAFSSGTKSGNSNNGGQFVLRGQDLLLAVNRSQKASNIKGQSISLA
jgi:hypothetical protein